jgi:large subunit ribosomal protein L22
MSPFKLRQVARTLRGRRAVDGRSLLQFVPRKSARLIGKVLGSAIANAESNFNVSVDDLMIDNVLIGEGIKLRRHISAAKGSAHPIRKRSSHITVILTTK